MTRLLKAASSPSFVNNELFINAVNGELMSRIENPESELPAKRLGYDDTSLPIKADDLS